MSAPRPLVLVGPTGAGKSCAGALVARRLGRPFIDVDARIEAARGMPVARVFAIEGEAAFRAHERAALHAALRASDAVVATGAGAVLDAASRDALAACEVVHLHAGIDAQLARLAGDATRPLLARDDRGAVLHAMAAARGPLYAAVARVRIDTDPLDAAAVADAIIDALETTT